MKSLVPILTKDEFCEVIIAFKREPKYISPELSKELEKEDYFIPVSRYSEWMVVENEIGILDCIRFIIIDKN